MAKRDEPGDGAEKTRDEALADGIARGVAEGLRAIAPMLKPQTALDATGISEARKKQLTAPPEPQRYRSIAWKSPDTGATGIAHVVESRAHPQGRIVRLEGYTHPPETYRFEADGGLVPDGFSMWGGDGRPRTLEAGREPQQGDLSPIFLQWRYERFYKADLARWIGRGMTSECSADERPLATIPWQTSGVAESAAPEA
jgi:hypothetical protein